MKFCEFLQIIYKNKNDNISTQEDYVVNMFCSGGAKFSYSEGYGKNLLSGKKPLSDDIRRLVTDKFDWDELCKFFYSNMNLSRVQDLFDIFKIPNDVEKDAYILCSAFCAQFKKFMDTGNEVNENINAIYEIFLDANKYGENQTDADLNAIFEAKKYIFNAVKSLSQINCNEDLLNCKTPFESFFSAIKSTHYAFIKNSTFKGRQLYRAFCAGAYKKDRPQDKFLYEVSIQNHESLNIIKQIKYYVYDNLKFKDSSATCTIDLFDDFEMNKRIDTLRKIDPKGKKEIYFTELIHFKINDSDSNLLDDYLYTLIKTIATFDFLEEKIGTNDKIKNINRSIKKAKENLDISLIQYITDGTFFPETGQIEYAPTMETIFYDKEGNSTQAGDILCSKDRIPFFIDKSTVKEKFNIMFSIHAREMARKGRIQEMMNEIYTFNDDGTFRLYYIVPTCKAKVYRKIRLIASRIEKDKTIGFMAFGVMSYFPVDEDKYLNMSTAEKESLAKDCFLGYYFENGNFNAAGLTEDQIKTNNIKNPDFIIQTNLYDPIIYEIMKVQKK